MTRRSLLLPALLGASLLLRVIPWAANLPLHHDEALYGTWARAVADGSDLLLLTPWVDKPPLVLYLLAFSLKLFGPSEMSLRLPGMLASVLTVLATYGMAWRLVGERAALLGAALLALSPFAILFGPTAFTDPWLTLFVIGAAWAAVAGQPLWSGALLGLACASKQQGVFGVPLILALLVSAEIPAADRSRRAGEILQLVGLALVGFAPIFGAATYWDSLRWHNRPSYWDQSLRTYGGVALVPLAEWPQRGAEWLRQIGYLCGAPAISALLLLAATISVRPGRVMGDGSDRQPRWTFLLAGYVLCYLLIHLVFSFQPWDRYLLPVLPLICILTGRGLLDGWSILRRCLPHPTAKWAPALLGLILVYGASLGVTAQIPVGSDIRAYEGVAEAAHFLSQQPAGTTVYYDRLGWHLGYYLYDVPIERSWYDGPAKLAREAGRVSKERPETAQWLMLPRWELDSLGALADALADQGLVARPHATAMTAGGTTGPTLYRIEQAPKVASSADPSVESTP